MKEKMKEEKINDALLKVALGYQVAEVTEEYAEVDGELKLTKRKKIKKDIPPDLKAVQLLLSAENEGNYSGWSDEELQAEKERLLAQLKEKQGVEKGVATAEHRADAVTETDADCDEAKVRKKVVKSKKMAGSVELNVKKPRPKPRKRVVRNTAVSTVGKHLKE